MLQIPLIVPQKFMLSVHSSLIAIQMEEVEEGEEESEKNGKSGGKRTKESLLIIAKGNIFPSFVY